MSSLPGSKRFRTVRRWLQRSALMLPLGLAATLASQSALAADGLEAGSLLTQMVAQQVQPNHYAAPVGGITLEQAADKVRRKTGGRVLSATPVEKGGRRGYNVRVLVDGKRVKQYYVDSEGRMSSR